MSSRTRRILSAMAFLALLTLPFRESGISQQPRVRQLAHGVWVRTPEPEKRIIANTGWIEFRDSVLVIDANFPWGARAILPDLRKTTSKPVRFVFDTHYHSDHAFGNAVFADAGATIICSEDCAEESRRKNTPLFGKSDDEKKFGDPSDRLEHPRVTFRDALVLDDGGMRVELIRVGPGHTLGDAVAYLPKQRILFAGGLCVNRPGINMTDADASPEGWLRALDALLLRDVSILVPGHGAIGDAQTLRGQRNYIAALIDAVRAGIRNGQGPSEISASANFSKNAPWGDDPARNAAAIGAMFPKLQPKQ